MLDACANVCCVFHHCLLPRHGKNTAWGKQGVSANELLCFFFLFQRKGKGGCFRAITEVYQCTLQLEGAPKRLQPYLVSCYLTHLEGKDNSLAGGDGAVKKAETLELMLPAALLRLV